MENQSNIWKFRKEGYQADGARIVISESNTFD